MIDKGVGGGIMVCIIDVLREGGSGVVLNVCWEGVIRVCYKRRPGVGGRIMIKRIAGGGGCDYPHSPPPSNMFHVEHFAITLYI